MGKLLLIVDDEPEAQTLLRLMLVRSNFEVVVAKNGTQALEMAHEHLPDLIILDIMMPGMDGFTVCQKLRSAEDTQNIPVIMLSAKTDVASRQRGEEAGATKYLTKPISPTNLVKQVQSILATAA